MAFEIIDPEIMHVRDEERQINVGSPKEGYIGVTLMKEKKSALFIFNQRGNILSHITLHDPKWTHYEPLADDFLSHFWEGDTITQDELWELRGYIAEAMEVLGLKYSLV